MLLYSLKTEINKIVLHYILSVCLIVGSKHDGDVLPKSYK